MGKLLITGASGFIGRRFIEKYADSYDISTVSLREIAASDINFYEVETVLHLSALVHQKKVLARDEYFKINFDQTVALAKSAKSKGVRHFIFFSTVAVYGTNGYLDGEPEVLINEDSSCNPIEPYGESKRSAELELLKMEDEGFMISIIRPPMVYGVGCPGNMANLMRMVRRAPILPFNYSDNRRSMVSVNNLIYFTNLIICNKVRGITIPQDAHTLSIRAIVESLAKGNNRRIFLFKFPGVIFSYLCSRRQRVMRSLYGSLVFDTRASNERAGFVAPHSPEDELYLMSSAGNAQE